MPDELTDLVFKIKPIIAKLNEDWEAVIPKTAPDNKKIRELVAALLWAQAKDIEISEALTHIVLAIGIYSYLIGYQRAQNIPVFFVSDNA